MPPQKTSKEGGSRCKGIRAMRAVKNPRAVLKIAVGAGTMAIASFLCLSISNRETFDDSLSFPALTPWQSVGGCGASSAGNRMGVRFPASIEPVLFDTSGTFGGKLSYGFLTTPNLATSIVVPELRGRLANAGFMLSLPVVFRHVSSGIGDMELGTSYLFRCIVPTILNAGLRLPTGKFDIMRGSDGMQLLLSSDLQSGDGVYCLNVGVSSLMRTGRGCMAVTGNIWFPFAMSFSGENRFLDAYYSRYKCYRDSADSDNKRRFYYFFKPYSENDLGDYFPPELSFAVEYSLPVWQIVRHVWSVDFGFPIGVSWEHNASPVIYSPAPNYNHRAWKSDFQYGVECNFLAFSLFSAISLPLYDKQNYSPNPYSNDDSYLSKLDAPDFDEFGQNWQIFLQMRTDDSRIKNAKKRTVGK